MSARANTLLERRLLLFTGKGGVGKSSVVAGLAAHLARQGRRPLVVELGHRASMEGMFGVEGVGYEPQPVGRGVWAMNVQFDHALGDYLAEHVKVKRFARAIVENRTLQKFFRAAPSVSEVATLNKISSLEAARDGGKPRWDPILVDLDATGHALMLLSLPSVLDGLIGDGPMRRLVDGFSSLLTDHRRTVLNLVTLPKALPAQETVELYTRLRADHGVHLGTLFVNQVPEQVPDASGHGILLAQLRARAQETGDQALLDQLQLAQRYREARARAQLQILRLRRDIALPVVELPKLDMGVGPDELLSFGALAAEAPVESTT